MIPTNRLEEKKTPQADAGGVNSGLARAAVIKQRGKISNWRKLKLQRQEKLRCNRQFRHTYFWGRRFVGPHLTLFCQPNHLPFNRLGLSVSKKSIKLSTHRHFVQRRLREAYRLNKAKLSSGHDLIIKAQRVVVKQICFADICSEFLALAQKAGMLKPGFGKEKNAHPALDPKSGC